MGRPAAHRTIALKRSSRYKIGLGGPLARLAPQAAQPKVEAEKCGGENG
jgi:hypothetical protein